MPKGCHCKGGRGFFKRAEDFASGGHFFRVSSADFGAGIGLYVSETDPIGTILGAKTPIENFRLASPKAQLGRHGARPKRAEDFAISSQGSRANRGQGQTEG